ncbi:MAG: hypothetical protein WCG47_33305 [Dermatophilaceae bacterium]
MVNIDAPPDLRPVAALLQSLAEQVDGSGLAGVWQMMVDSFHLELLSAANQQLARSSGRVDDDLLRSYWSELLSTPVDDTQRMVDDALSRLTADAVPYLLVLGSPMPAGAVSAIEAQLPYATVEIWPDGVHFPHLAHTARFADVLAASALWRPGIPPSTQINDP